MQMLKYISRGIDVWFYNQKVFSFQIVKWSVYLLYRNIFERAITLNLAAKKMKFIFKRYVTFEEQHGTKATVVEAQRKSDEYMDGQMFQEME